MHTEMLLNLKESHECVCIPHAGRGEFEDVSAMVAKFAAGCAKEYMIGEHVRAGQLVFHRLRRGRAWVARLRSYHIQITKQNMISKVIAKIQEVQIYHYANDVKNILTENENLMKEMRN